MTTYQPDPSDPAGDERGVVPDPDDLAVDQPYEEPSVLPDEDEQDDDTDDVEEERPR